MDNNTYEQEINLKDLMFLVFRKWRLILVVAFILAILLGGYKAGKELISLNNDEFMLNIKEEYEKELEKYQKEEVGYKRDIENLTANIEYQERYKENSLLLKIDPYHKRNATVDIFIKMPEYFQESGAAMSTVDFADGVLKAYASAIQKGTFLEDLSKKNRIDLIYLQELITVTEDYDSNMINISVTSVEEEDAEEILNKILENIEPVSAKIQENLGQHSISFINQSTGYVTDQILADYQQQKIKNLADTNKSLKDTEKALKELKEPERPVVLSKGLILKEGIKYSFLGGVAGVFLLAFGVCVICLMDEKFKIDNDLKERFGIKLLGGFSEVKQERIFSCIDVWLDRLEGKEYLSDGFVYDTIAANINNFADKKGTVFLTGTVEEMVLRELEIQLKKRIPQLNLEIGSDMTKNVSILQKLPEYDEVILVETRNKSRCKDIEKEVEMVLNLKKTIIGYIILDSNESCVKG